MKWFLSEWKQYGFKTAWYNFKFELAFRHLNAKSMKVVQKRR